MNLFNVCIASMVYNFCEDLHYLGNLIEFELICFRDNIEQQTTWTTHLCYIIRRN